MHMAKQQATAAHITQAIGGLTFRTSEQVQDQESKKARHVPHRRPMTEADVMSAVADGDTVCLVCKDGSKHRVALGQAKKTDEDKGKGKDK